MLQQPKKSWIIVIFVFIFFCFIIKVILNKSSHYRSANALLNHYYLLKKENPNAAINALKILLDYYPRHVQALTELGQWYLNKNQFSSALGYLEKAHRIQANNATVNFLLGNTYRALADQSLKQHQIQPAINYLATAYSYDRRTDTLQSLAHLKQMSAQRQLPAKEIPHHDFFKTQYEAKTSQTIKNDILLQNFSEKILQTRLKKMAIYKNRSKTDSTYQILEKAYLALEHHHVDDAITLFEKAYLVAKEPFIALQLGYLYNQGKQNSKAYDYFKKARNTNSKIIKEKAENALIILSPAHQKILPEPFFTEFYFAPVFLSRFNIVIFPAIARLGYSLSEKFNTEIYGSLRFTKDNESSVSNSISQIYQDNAAIIALGFRSKFIKNLPLSFFIEGGKAYDFIYQNRNRWRYDLRSGLIYYQEWQSPPTYADSIKFSRAWFTNIYGEIIYFSRFNNNIIGTMRAREGYDLVAWHNSVLQTYFIERLSVDSKKEFYNNYFELGPGVAFTPNNHYNMTLRYEILKGYFFPVHGTTINPYGSHYFNQAVSLEFYTRF